MKTMRPQFRCFMPGRYARLRRTPLSTLTSKNRRQSSSGISSNGLGLENAEVVHENIHEREPPEQRLCRRPRGEISREAFNPGTRHGLINPLLRLNDRFVRATVHDDSCAFASQPGGDGKSNAFGGARDQGGLVS